MLPSKWHRYIFLLGLFSLVAGMLFGTVPTSVPQFILAGNWLLELNFKAKWNALKLNKVFWVLISFYLLHLLGMLYTQDISRGTDDLRNKLPLLTLPIILLSTKPINSKELKNLFLLFFLAVIVSSLCCFFVYLGFTKKIIIDVRQASIFMSHIRFSLFIAFSVIGMFYFFNSEKQNALKISYTVAVVWLLFFMYKLEMATGFLCLLITLFIIVMHYCYKSFSLKINSLIAFSVLFVFVFLAYKVFKDVSMYDKSSNSSANILLKNTYNGRDYLQDTLFNLAENGNLITININDEELKQEWEKRSGIVYEGNDNKGNNLRFTILRYLSSYGFTKDSVGISKLTLADINNIENGLSNYNYSSKSGLSSRWRELVWEYVKYKRGENPSGHTLTMRLEFWKTAIYIIKNNFLLGVGTGDAQLKFNEAYQHTNSSLIPEWRLRSHNQYLAVGVSFGVIGLLFFFFYLAYPCFKLHDKLHFLYWPFLIIVLLSFLTEDTLETQSGVSFFIVFQTLFLWLASYRFLNSVKPVN